MRIKRKRSAPGPAPGSPTFQKAPHRFPRFAGLATAKETLWGAVSAVTYYADHVRSGTEERLDGAWFGAGYALKEKAWDQASVLVS